MLVLETGDKLQGDAATAAEVDYTVHGLDNSALKQLADGQLANAIGDLYTADSTDVVSTITLVNTGSAQAVNLYFLASGGTARRLIPKDMSLGAGYSLHTDGKSFTVVDASGNVQVTGGGAYVEDDAYGAGWNGDTSHAPSQNAVYDMFNTHASRHDAGGSDQIHSISDDDDDTKIQVEEAADEDHIRMDVNGVEAFDLQDAGILTLAKQSAVVANLSNGSANQVIPTSSATYIMFDAETTDVQNEFDISVKIGTASATSANHLIDTTLSPFVAADVGRKVWNTTDNTYTYITAYNSTSDVTVANDIFASGEGYKAYRGRFTATVAGRYSVVLTARINNLGDTKYMIGYILKNGAVAATVTMMSSHVDYDPVLQTVSIVSLAISDYIDFAVWHSHGSVRDLQYGAGWTNVRISKIT